MGYTGLALRLGRTRATKENPSARCLFITARPTVAVAAMLLEKAEALAVAAAAVGAPAPWQAVGATIAIPWQVATQALA